MIKTVELPKKFITNEVETTALRRVNASITPGEFVAIMGPSGGGKSTILNILGLIVYPTAYEFYFYGQNVVGFYENQRADLRKKNIGFVFKGFNLMDASTVYENIELPLIYQKLSAAEIKLELRLL